VQERGWLLDGYPRSASQAEAIEKEGIRPDIFLLIDVRICPSDNDSFVKA
jgi:adenylate kinase